MNQRLIRRLRVKFIIFATSTYFLVMAFMGSILNVANYYLTLTQIHGVLDYLADNEGLIALLEDEEDQIGLGKFAPEYRYTMRYFSVIYEEDRETVEKVRMGHVSQLNSEEGLKMAYKAVHRSGSYGRMGEYYWRTKVQEDGGVIAVFLNCQTQIAMHDRIVDLTLLIAGAGLIITFLLVSVFSGRIIAPELENMRRQKQFITNASHELKTPLAVIRANTELSEMMNGEDEWTQSTMRQVDRLNGLVQNLVMIARAQEQEDRSELARINISPGVEETVQPYTSLAQQEKKQLVREIQPEVMMLADESKIRQLTALLVDNAFKYCDEEGTVLVRLSSLRKGRQVRLVVSNSYAEGKTVDYSRFFDRFYREDQSHNVDRGGYGIGLSIAESICHQYSGSITASWRDGMISFICLLST